MDGRREAGRPLGGGGGRPGQARWGEPADSSGQAVRMRGGTGRERKRVGQRLGAQGGDGRAHGCPIVSARVD